MVLSKLAPRTDSTLMVVVQRLRDPFAEIAADLLDMFGITVTDENDEPLVQATLVGGQLQLSRLLGGNLATAFQNLIQSLGLCECHLWTVSLALSAVLTGPMGVGAGSCWISAGGIWLPLKVVFGGVSLAMAAGAFVVMQRFGSCASETGLQRRWVIGLLLCSAFHSGLTLMLPSVCAVPGGLGEAVGATAGHYLKDFVINPLIITNLAYLAGLDSRSSPIPGGLTVSSTAGLALIASVSCNMFSHLSYVARLLAPPPLKTKMQHQHACRKGRTMRRRRLRTHIAHV